MTDQGSRHNPAAAKDPGSSGYAEMLTSKTMTDIAALRIMLDRFSQAWDFSNTLSKDVKAQSEQTYR
jgi:hypothetical protein